MGIVTGRVNAGIFLVLSLLHIFDCRSITPKNTVFHQARYLADVIFDRALLRELKTSRVGCASTCHIHPKCRSYFYNKADHVCRTHSTIFTDNAGSIPAIGWHYYGRHAASVKRKLVPTKQMQTGESVTTPYPGVSSLFRFAQNVTTPLPVTDITDDDNDNDEDYQEGSDVIDRVTTDPARGGTTESPPEVTSSYLVTENPGRTGETKTTLTVGPEGRTKDSKVKAIPTPNSPEDDRETTKGPKVAAIDLDVSTSTVDKEGQPTVGEINPSKTTDGVDTVTVNPKDVETKGVTLDNNVDQKTVPHEFETTDSSDIRESERNGMDDIQESQITDSMDIQEPERTNPSDVHEPDVISTISDRTGVVNTHDVSSPTEGSRSAPIEHAVPTGVDKTSTFIHSHTSVPHDEDVHDELSFLTTQEQNAIIELAMGVTAPGTTLSASDDGDDSEGLTVVVMVGDDEETKAHVTTFTEDPSMESSIRMMVTDAGLHSDDDDDDLKINIDNDVDEGINLFDDDDQGGLRATMDLTNMMTTTMKLPPERNDPGHVTKSPPYDLTKEQSVFDKILHKPTERPPYSSEPVAVRVVVGVIVVVAVCLAGSGVYAWYVRRRTGSFNILKKSEDGLGLQLITST